MIGRTGERRHAPHSGTLSTTLCFASILMFAVSGQVFPSVLSELPGSAVEHGLLLFALFLFFPIASAGAGFAADRIGKKRMLIGGALLMSLTFLVSTFVSSIGLWILAVLFFGIGSGVVEGQASAELADLHPGRESRYLNASQSFYSVGAVVGPFYILFLFQLFPGIRLQTAFLTVCLLNLALVLGLTLLREKPHGRRAPEPAGLMDLLRDREWRMVGLSLFIYVAEEMGTASWLEKYARDVLGLAHPLTAVYIAVFWAGLGVSRTLVGLNLLRLETRRILALSVAASIVFRVLAFSLRIPILTGSGVLFLGMSLGAVWPTLVGLAGVRFRSSTGAAVGVVVAVGGMAAALIQPVVGFLSAPGRLGLQPTMLLLLVFPIANLVLVRRLATADGPDAARG